MKKIIFSFTFFFAATPLICQHLIKGKALDFDKSPLYNIEVIEDSLNYTTTDYNGNFSIEVRQLPTTLTFRSLEMDIVTRTVQINSDTSFTVFLKYYALVHYFESQKVGIFLQPGLINAPVGGRLYLTSPYFLNSRLIKGSYTYQSNLDENNFIGASLTLENIIANPNFGAGLSITYQNPTLDQYQLVNKTIEVDLRSRYVPLEISLGYSKLNINDLESVQVYNGLAVTARRYFSNLFKIEASSKLLVFDGLNGYQFQLERRFNRLWSSVAYQQLDSYSEFSIGLGYVFTYIFNDPNTY